jgi:hypothetical protein
MGADTAIKIRGTRPRWLVLNGVFGQSTEFD